MSEKEIIKKLCKNIFDLISPEKQPDLDKYADDLYTAMRLSPKITQWNGYNFLPGFDANLAKYVYEQWQPKKGDVVVSSFAKTGTTWVREIVRQIVYRKDKTLLKQTNIMRPYFAYLSMVPKDEKFQVVDNFPMDRRVFGTHIPASLFNFEKFNKNGAKVIYVIRNPKDQAVSLYYFLNKLTYSMTKPYSEMWPKNENDFYDLCIEGKQRLFGKDGEGYLEHVRGWYDHKNDDNVMFLCYEDMKEDICSQLKKIGNFIGEDLTEEEIRIIAHATSIGEMRSSTGKVDTSISSLVLRKGEVGKWEEHLSLKQSELIDLKVEEILGDTDIEFKYYGSKQMSSKI